MIKTDETEMATEASEDTEVEAHTQVRHSHLHYLTQPHCQLHTQLLIRPQFLHQLQGQLLYLLYTFCLNKTSILI